jgi:hypothetical protein
VATEFTDTASTTAESSAAAQLAKEPGLLPPQADARQPYGGQMYQEIPEVVTASRWRWETYVKRFESVLMKPRLQDLWPWAGIMLATVPPLVGDNFTLTWLGIGPGTWRLGFGVLTLFSLLNVARIVAASVMVSILESKWYGDIPIVGYFLQRSADWVPRNCADFIDMCVAQIKREQAGAVAGRASSPDTPLAQ